MHFDGVDSSVRPLVAVFFIAAPLFFGAACSKEEQKEVQTPRVVVPITSPVREIPQVALVNERLNTEPGLMPAAIAETASLEDEEGQPDSPALIENPEEQAVVQKEAGYYRVQKGDSLSKVAGREDVYGNPLMWPSLFRLNMDKLGGIKVAEAFGAVGLRATKPEEVEPVIRKAMETPRPVIMDFVVDREECVMPMVPPGKASHEMLLA